MAAPEILAAAEVLRRGGLVALPTETVYGLGADAENELAVRRIFAAKGRPSSHPLIVHLASADLVPQWARTVPDAARTLMKTFWPGPLTLVLPRTPKSPDAVTGGQDTVALRVPAHPLALALLEEFGSGIAAPSANRFGKVSPTTAAHVREELGDAVDLVLDGGPCTVGVESTIVDLSGPLPRLLRPGGVSLEALERALGAPVQVATAADDVRAPGMLASHYSPRAGLCLATPATLAAEAARCAALGAKVAALCPGPVPLPAGVTAVPVPADAAGYARELYATLRALDAQGFDIVVAVLPAEAGLGRAVRDRLTRAATKA